MKALLAALVLMTLSSYAFAGPETFSCEVLTANDGQDVIVKLDKQELAANGDTTDSGSAQVNLQGLQATIKISHAEVLRSEPNNTYTVEVQATGASGSYATVKSTEKESEVQHWLLSVKVLGSKLKANVNCKKQ